MPESWSTSANVSYSPGAPTSVRSPEITTWFAPTRFAQSSARPSLRRLPCASSGRPKLRNRVRIDHPDRVRLGLGSSTCASERCAMRVIPIASMLTLLLRESAAWALSLYEESPTYKAGGGRRRNFCVSLEDEEAR